MSKQLNKVRRRLESRRRDINDRVKKRERSAPMIINRHDEAREDPEFYYHPLHQQEKPVLPTKSRDFLLLRTLAAVCLLLVVALLFNNSNTQFEGARQVVKGAYEQQFQFAAISEWYENQFGRPLALLPLDSQVALGDVQENQPEAEVVYAVPALGGRIRENFQQNGRGILIETGMNTEVEAVKGGQVLSVGGGEKGLAKTVIVQHPDGTEATYGMLDDVTVNIYDHIKSGHKIGTVSTSEQTEKGIFYFSLKDGETYVDPSDVISFE